MMNFVTAVFLLVNTDGCLILSIRVESFQITFLTYDVIRYVERPGLAYGVTLVFSVILSTSSRLYVNMCPDTKERNKTQTGGGGEGTAVWYFV